MSTIDRQLERHYARPHLAERLLEVCRAAAGTREGEPVPRDLLGQCDEFHIRGREATRELARLAGVQPGDRVLDIGCGVGGPARALSAEFDADVTGVDPVPEFVRTADVLTRELGATVRVRFQVGSATRLPFVDGSFDVAWLQHATMNVADKSRLFAEARRVLAPGGRLALYEICAGSPNPVHFPVPWASEPALSYLTSPGRLREMVREAGFAERAWEDVTDLSLAWFASAADASASAAGGRPVVGLHLLLGDAAGQKLANMTRNLSEGRIRVVRGVWARR